MFADPLDTVKPAHFSSANRDLFNFLCVFLHALGISCSILFFPFSAIWCAACCERRVGGCVFTCSALDGLVPVVTGWQLRGVGLCDCVGKRRADDRPSWRVSVCVCFGCVSLWLAAVPSFGLERRRNPSRPVCYCLSDAAGTLGSLAPV
jgi:hypothetical protein